MYTLDSVIKKFKSIIKESDNDLLISYYEIIIGFMLIEKDNVEIVEQAGKPIYHYFKYTMPVAGNDYFLYLYNNRFSGVRYSVETFDSINQIKTDIENFNTHQRKSCNIS